MSEQYFQSQLASIMEILVKAAVRETTKLYETGVLDLKIEIAQIKQENETLKSRLQSSENVWRVREQQSAKNDRLNHNLQTGAIQQEEESCSRSWLFSAPSCLENGEEEEEEVTTVNPISSFKEESSEVEFILIKQEDSDIEDYTPEISPLKWEKCKEMATSEAVLRAASENTLPAGAAPFPHVGETAPADMQPTAAEGREASPGNDKSRRALVAGGPPCKAEPRSRQVPQKPHQTRVSCTDAKSSEDRAEAGGLSGLVFMEGGLQENGEPLSSSWPAVQNPAVEASQAQPVGFTEEEVGFASFSSKLLKSHCANNHLTDFPHHSHKSRLQVAQHRQPVAETDAIFPGQKTECLSSRDGHDRFGHLSQQLLDAWSPGSMKPLNALARNRQQEQQQGFPFQCGQCGRILSSATALEAHQSLHTGERPYSCSECGKAFPSLRGLNRHSQVHSGERQHHCHQCGKSFVYQFSLTKHQLIHSGERAHTCKHCEKSFVFKSDLAIHMRMHTGETPYSCNICGKEFKHRRALNMHLQGHSGERRHHCTYCGKSFLDLGNFKRHKRIHTGEKPYSCQLCGKRFTQSAHLKKHFLTHK